MSTITQSLPSTARKAKSAPSRRKRKNAVRTTVTLSPEAIEIVERFKAVAGFSTSGAIEELILRSEPQKSWLIEKDGFLLMNAPLKNGKLTNEDVKRLLEECPF